jgi:hypothetical protein
MEDINYLMSLHKQSKHTKMDVYLKFLEMAHANLLGMAG